MNDKHLSETVFQHTNEITELTRKVNVIENDLQTVIRDQSKLEQLVEAQIRTNFEISNIKDDLKETNTNIAFMNIILKNIEANLMQKDIAEKTKSSFKADLRKYLPALLIVCAAMFIFGLILDDMTLIKTIFGK